MRNIFDIAAGPETDALIHHEVFKRTDAPSPYSTDVATAEWMCAHFGLKALPIYHSDEMWLDPATDDLAGSVQGYSIMSFEERGDDIEGLQIFAEAKCFALAVARSVLMMHGLAEDTRRWADV